MYSLLNREVLCVYRCESEKFLRYQTGVKKVVTPGLGIDVTVGLQRRAGDLNTDQTTLPRAFELRFPPFYYYDGTGRVSAGVRPLSHRIEH